MTLLLDAIRAHARNKPDAIAIDGDDAICWRELAELIPLLSAELTELFEMNRPVAMQIGHGVGETLLDLTLLEASVPTIPLPPFFSEQQIHHALGHAGAPVMMTGPVTVIKGRQPRFQLSAIATNYPATILPVGTARITFTSGSTGTPKGICLSRDHILGVANGVVNTLGTHHAGRHLPIMPPGILLENVAGLYATLLAGGTYVALPQTAVGMDDPFRPDFLKMLLAIVSAKITSLIVVPEYLRGLVAVMRETGIRLPRLTLVAVGGARIDHGLLDAADLVGLPVQQGYGLTECASVVALDDGSPESRGSVGRCIGVNTIQLADDGEVLIDGPLFLGTIGHPRPPSPLATGDLGRFDADGRLWIEGRKSALIITSHGRNISPEWIEGVLTSSPAILQAMVRGDGRASLDALIVSSAANADVAAAVAAANLLLPTYAQVASWRVVPPFSPADGLLTGNGRLRRAAIDAAYPYQEKSVNTSFFDRLVLETSAARAQFATTPQLLAGLSGHITRADYLAYLTQAFHHVRHTVPLMQEARSRIAHRPVLVAALDDYIVEETGHEYWILDDINTVGGNGAVVAKSGPGDATKAMTDYAYRTVREGNPAAFFGMVYVLESISIAMASQGAGALQKSLGLPDTAFRYLTSHGALDQEHMVFFENLMGQIDDVDDQQAIIDMANAMFGLFADLFSGIVLENANVAA